ncbi:peptidylprolyl isomerase [Vibrio sp. JC009]|uniref:peptidylprolyl isomerase n=1 Tax=Vibrio sp. JC009 TaxID=2912314 RepID=UPI0023AECCA1|nr:peptidylprolyl isomerase [Vibrio sp. JC009]WED24085.1 peptidylprolyl isomerase [Vibrio sp. JC009]
MDEQKRRYLLVKLSTEKYKLNPEYLSGVQRAQIEEEVEKLYRMQSSIMSSKEAQAVRISGDQVMKTYQECVGQFESEEELYFTLKKQGITLEGYKSALKDELYCEKILDYIAREIPDLDRQQALDYYNKNLLEFSRARTWKVSQILITINDEFNENTRENALSRINEVREELKTKPFSELAMKYSECPSALEEGSLGWCEEGKLYPQITTALYKLTKEEVSQVVETEVGFHLVKFHEEKTPYVATFEEAWPFLKEKHSSRAKTYIQRQWMAQLTGSQNETI